MARVPQIVGPELAAFIPPGRFVRRRVHDHVNHRAGGIRPLLFVLWETRPRREDGVFLRRKKGDGSCNLPYLSLYRKYRPRNFAEIVGQRHVTQTLGNAIKASRIAHAYLFCGPRGTGKTSTARVLAMSLNCEQGPTEQPCGECEACRRIVAGNALDVIEIDAASNRGIDEIRELRERVGLAPAGGRMKVYIIDEVHMLTGEAFNAFLKTLEEPPAHVVFVLATTEPHRVLPTILSRCQRFDFHRVGLGDLEGIIRDVAAKEQLKIADKAVTMLAHAADGAGRNALTLLDQAVAYADAEVTAEVVTEILGGVDFDLLVEFTEIVIRRDMGEALGFVERVVTEGKDIRQFVGELIEHFRNLLMLNVDRRGRDTVSLPDESVEKLVEQAQSLPTADVVSALDVLAETDRELRFTSQPRLLVELAAVRLCRSPGPAAQARGEERKPEPRKTPTKGQERTVRDKAADRRDVREAVDVPTGGDASPGLAEMRDRWDELLSLLRKERRSAEAAFLREAIPAALEDDTLVLEFNHQFHHDQLTDKRRQTVADAVRSMFGVDVKIARRMASPTRAEDRPKGSATTRKGSAKLDDVLSIFPGSELEE